MSPILINNQNPFLRQQLLETLIHFNVLRKIPTQSDALPLAKLEENIIDSLKGNFGAKQEQIECIDLHKEIEHIVSTTSCVKMHDGGVIVTLNDTPNTG